MIFYYCLKIHQSNLNINFGHSINFKDFLKKDFISHFNFNLFIIRYLLNLNILDKSLKVLLIYHFKNYLNLKIFKIILHHVIFYFYRLYLCN